MLYSKCPLYKNTWKAQYVNISALQTVSYCNLSRTQMLPFYVSIEYETFKDLGSEINGP